MEIQAATSTQESLLYPPMYKQASDCQATSSHLYPPHMPTGCSSLANSPGKSQHMMRPCRWGEVDRSIREERLMVGSCSCLEKNSNSPASSPSSLCAWERAEASHPFDCSFALFSALREEEEQGKRVTTYCFSISALLCSALCSSVSSSSFEVCGQVPILIGEDRILMVMVDFW